MAPHELVRAVPGKANKGPAPGGTGVKQRMQKQDFEKRKEWVQVLDDIAALGEDSGSTKAVQAGVTPQGQEFIWCLMRGKKVRNPARLRRMRARIARAHAQTPVAGWPRGADRQRRGAKHLRHRRLVPSVPVPDAQF
jgi:hypothetical protein